MKLTRLYTGKDNKSHFEEIDIPLEDRGPIGMLSKSLPAAGIIFRETGKEYNYSWHNAPCRQFVIMLNGEVEIEVGDGTMQRFGAGDILLAEDTSGQGHISRTVSKQPRKSIFVTLD